jgi:hypothetical protein
MKRKKTNFPLFLSKGKHRCLPCHLSFFTLQLSLLSSCLCINVAGVYGNPKMHYYLLYITLILSWWKSVSSAMLSG